MTIATSLKQMLDRNHLEYEVIEHEPAFTAQQEAHATHTPGRNWAKTVGVLVDGEPALAVLPASRKVDLDRLRAMTGAAEVRLTEEKQFQDLYPDCELGAMSPFGNLYGQTTFVDESLREDEYIVFHAGDHRTAVKMPYTAFEELAAPVPGTFS